MALFDFLRKGKKEEKEDHKGDRGEKGQKAQGKESGKTAKEKASAPAAPAGGEAAAAGTEAATGVRLDDVMKTVESEISDRLTDELKKVAKLYGKINHGLAEARKHASELEKKKFEAGDKTYAVVNMTKDNYVKKANSLISGSPRINNFNYEETSAFCTGTKKILNDLLNIPPKQAILLTRYFKKESSKMITVLKETDVAFMEMETLLNSSMLGFYSAANKNMVDIWQLVYRSEDLAGQAEKISGRIKAAKAELAEREKEAGAFASGEEGRKHSGMVEEIKKLEAERTELGNIISDRLSAIKRPLKKLEHAAANEGGKDKASLYSRISHSPMKVLMQEQGDALLMEALEKLRDIGLKDEERERVEELMKKIELGYISELTDKYKWLETELAEKRKEFEKSAFPEKNKKHEREIENLRRGISELEKEAGKVSKSMAELAGKTSSEKGDLEEMVMKETGLRLNILLENHAGQEAGEVERNGKNE